MTPPPPNQQPRTLLGVITQAVQTVQAKVNFSQLALKPNARVPELWVQDANADQADIFPLLGDRYLLGRSSKSCDIVVKNPVVSQVHLSISRDSQRRNAPFIIKDEDSTNGIFLGKRRITSLCLRHGDVFTLGPAALQASVRLQYYNPPPWYVRVLTWSSLGVGGVTGLLALWMIFIEWPKIPVQPLPRSVQGPVIVYAGDEETPLRSPCNNSHIELKSIKDFSPYLPKAVVASEDSRFYWHIGVDPWGIIRALVTNIRGGEIREGASTLTQQLSRSLFREYVGTQDSAGRKIREAIVSLKLETFYSKDELLRAYLNQVYLGVCAYGFEDAAQFYFGKSAKDLDLSEAATLVGVLPAPNRFNPALNYQTSLELRDRVISRMATLGMVSEEEAQRARRSRIEITPKARQELQGTIAPYFYSYVFSELEDLLPNVASEGNFIVETALDRRMQSQAELSLHNGINNYGSTMGFSQGALVTLNTNTGAILALTGGLDYAQSQFNRVTQAKRQPGSTFKIFTYTAAIEQGISPGTAYSCAPLDWGGQTFEGCESGSGSLNMYAAIAASENVIALRIAENVGLNKVVEMARKMGIKSTLNPVPGLVLGQSEVSVLELTGAFAVLANHGVRNHPHSIIRIRDSSDCQDHHNPKTCRIIYEYDTNSDANQQVISPQVADIMTNLLQGVVRSGTGSAASIGLGDEAGKTGTTNNGVDLWFVGYIPSRDLVTGIWLGNDNNAPTSGYGANAAQIWGDYMRKIIK